MSFSCLQPALPRVLGLFLLTHLLVWTVLPSLLFPNLSLDVSEGFLWGQTLQWGYYKHPPLQAWLLEGVYQLFGTQAVGYFLLAQITAVTAMLGVYYSALRLTDQPRAVLATLALAGIHYFNVTSLEFNPNTLQLPLWAWAGYFFLRSLERGWWRDWLLLGLLLALAAYAKYFGIILALSMLLFVVLDGTARRTLRTPKPYVAALFCLCLLVPHFYWLAQHEFLPFTYALARGQTADGSFLSHHLMESLLFMLAQGAALLLAGLMLISTGLRFKGGSFSVLTALAWLPLFLTVMLAVLTGLHLHDMWGTPLLSFIPLYWLHYHTPPLTEARIRGFLYTLTFASLFLVAGVALAQSSGKAFGRMNFDGRGLAGAWQADWPAAKPPYAIIAERWLGANGSFYASPRPLVLIEGDLQKSPWIDLEQLNAQGAVVLAEDKSEGERMVAKHQLAIDWQLPLTVSGQTYQMGWIHPAQSGRQAQDKQTRENNK